MISYYYLLQYTDDPRHTDSTSLHNFTYFLVFVYIFLNLYKQGRFEILSLSGSFLLSESGGQRSRTGGLSVSLAGPDGHVLGGGVEGLLTAASPVQVILV